MSVAPTLDYEKRFLPRGARFLAGVDEVGRGALAGPVSVGITVVDLQHMELLADVRDSKLLKAADRERLDPLVRAWSVASAVGHASAREIDDLGIMGALRADMQCLTVAAASVLAKVERDQHMQQLHLEYPDFGWDVNKGYGTALHREAIRTRGPSPYHRVSWNLLSE
jgi:ribonuclease HII